MDILWIVLGVLYLLAWGGCFVIGLAMFPQALENYWEHAPNRPYYTKIQPLLACAAFFMGPLALALYFGCDKLVPEQYKKRLHSK